MERVGCFSVRGLFKALGPGGLGTRIESLATAGLLIVAAGSAAGCYVALRTMRQVEVEGPLSPALEHNAIFIQDGLGPWCDAIDAMPRYVVLVIEWLDC